MAAARYHSGQALQLLRDLRSPKIQADGLYTIVGVQPNEGLEQRYRIKNEAEAFDRVVAESQLAEPTEE